MLTVATCLSQPHVAAIEHRHSPASSISLPFPCQEQEVSSACTPFSDLPPNLCTACHSQGARDCMVSIAIASSVQCNPQPHPQVHPLPPTTAPPHDPCKDPRA